MVLYAYECNRNPSHALALNTIIVVNIIIVFRCITFSLLYRCSQSSANIPIICEYHTIDEATVNKDRSDYSAVRVLGAPLPATKSTSPPRFCAICAAKAYAEETIKSEGVGLQQTRFEIFSIIIHR